jgi:hypothetical protein
MADMTETARGPAALATLPLDGEWVNAAGSSLIITEHGGALAGVYRTAIGAADHGRAYPLTGWRNGRCLGFTVSWAPESDSVTAWTALLHDDGAPALHALWVLVRDRAYARGPEGIAERPAAPWEAFSVQTSVFGRLG